MGDKGKIDKLFSGGLDDFEASPQSDSWARINATMEKNHKKKRGLYLRWASIAAAMVLAFYAGYNFNQNADVETPTKEIKTQPGRPNYISDEKNSEQIEQIEQNDNLVLATKAKPNKNKSGLPNKSKNTPARDSATEESIAVNNTSKTSVSNNTSDPTVATSNPTTAANAIVAANIEDNSNDKIGNLELEPVETIEAQLDTFVEQKITSAAPMSSSNELLDYYEKTETSNALLSRFSVSAMIIPFS